MDASGNPVTVREGERLTCTAQGHALGCPNALAFQDLSIFDMALDTACAKYGTSVPVHLQRLVEEIERRALDEEGLYRLPGARSAVGWPWDSDRG